MNEIQFNIMVSKLQKVRDNCSALYKLGVCIREPLENLHEVITILLDDKFEEHKKDVFNWFLYEYRKGKMVITSSKTGEVLYVLDREGDFWKYMNEE